MTSIYSLGLGNLGSIGLCGTLVVCFAIVCTVALDVWAIRRYGKAIYSPVVMKNIFPRSRREWLLVSLAGLAWAAFNVAYIVLVSFAPELLVVRGYSLTQAS